MSCMSATCTWKCVTVNSGGLSHKRRRRRKIKHILPCRESAYALRRGIWRATCPGRDDKGAARHLILSSVSEEAPRETARVCDSLIGNRVPLLRVWYSAALQGDCLLSCLLSGIIRAGGCGSGLAGSNNPGPGSTSPPSAQMKDYKNKSTAAQSFVKLPVKK